MDLFVGVTDGDWYELLASQPTLDEVNFWRPRDTNAFRALQPGGLFLFKLHSPKNFIVGGGIYAHWSLLPASLAWDAFEIGNGATSLGEMRQRIEKYKYRSQTPPSHEDYKIGCILLEQPFFFTEADWIPVPEDWHLNIVQGKGYDTATTNGMRLWTDVAERMRRNPASASALPVAVSDPKGQPRFGEPIVIHPRLGQGSFRVLVTDAYERRCAVTKERTLPVLEAAHIRPYAEGGEHRVDNGLLLRRDLHTLFDRGYITVTPELKLEVSKRLREDFANGRDYYALQGRELWLPMPTAGRPRAEFLAWHNDTRYLG
jgi:putative restriction endonuclease